MTISASVGMANSKQHSSSKQQHETDKSVGWHGGPHRDYSFKGACLHSGTHFRQCDLNCGIYGQGLLTSSCHPTPLSLQLLGCSKNRMPTRKKQPRRNHSGTLNSPRGSATLQPALCFKCPQGACIVSDL